MVSASSDESALVEASRLGDKDAFTTLVMRHQGYLRAYAGGFVRDKVMVDDLCQESFLQAFRDLKSWRQDGPFIVWLLGIARHRVLDYPRSEQRARARQTQSDLLEHVLIDLRAQAVDDDADDLIAHERQMRALRSCVDALPIRNSALIKDHYFAAQTANEIAAKAGKGPSAVRMMLLRTRETLRECIESRMLAESKWTTNATRSFWNAGRESFKGTSFPPRSRRRWSALSKVAIPVCDRRY